MIFSSGYPTQTDEGMYNSRLIKNYAEYVRKYHPGIDIDAILEKAGITIYQVEDQGHWFTQEEVDRFHETLIKQTKDPGIPREVGRFAGSSQASNAVRQYALGFITPASAYWVAQKISSNLSRGFTLKTKQITHNKIEITVRPNPGVKEKPYQCENRMGYLESVAKLFTNRLADIEHPSCLHRGDKIGRYIISWEKTPFLNWKRLFNYSVLIGIGVFSVLFFVLSTVPWLISVLLYGFLSMMCFFYAAYLEKNHLTETIKAQGNAAKDLLNEMDIRYNNALLVQEIGQATSTILDIDKVVCEVVRIMEKRLDFDRGMIMLQDDEKKRLTYSVGYGYSQEVEGILKNMDFNLGNPDSRGVVVRAFREKVPFLVNDIADIERDVSRKSLEYIKEIGGESFICVPIIYKNESLGVLLVDNIKSKRPLRQSDVNLLMGVASQTALNIVEAMSVKKLQESEKKYRDLVENANSIILRMDTEGDIIFFNEFAQKFFGYSEKDVLGKNIQGTILPGAESTRRNFGELITSLQKDPERPVASEDEYLLRNGRKAWVAWTYKPIFDYQGYVVEILCIGNDITGLRRAEHEKEDLEAQLRGAQKMEAIGTLAGGIAHDFNNILQGIFSYIQILLMKKDQDDPDYHKFRAIEKAAQRASELTRRLLIFSRKVKSKLKPVDLNQEVVQVSKMLEMTIPKMITIELKLAGNLKTINADPVQIEQIMMNLGVNARDAMPNGGSLYFKTENITLDEEFCENHLGSRPGEYVLLSVSDTGHGIDEELQPHIFEPFFTTKETGQGTGLGLAMVYGLVKSHSGYITFKSKPDRGTVFEIYFPVKTSDGETKDSKEAEPSIVGGNETILLVDDEESIRKPGEEMLANFGYKVISVSDGESALELYRKEPGKIDLVILDLIMPGMGGGMCLQELIKINPLVNVIVASGYSINGKEKEVIEAQAKGFIRKPYSVREMLNLVREVLDLDGG